MDKVFAMDDSDDIVKEFLVESYENLDRLDRDLITLEKNPHDREVLGSTFRTIHTIKGTSGFLAFDQPASVPSNSNWKKRLSLSLTMGRSRCNACAWPIPPSTEGARAKPCVPRSWLLAWREYAPCCSVCVLIELSPKI